MSLHLEVEPVGAPRRARLPLVVREATAGDTEALIAMHARCSPDSLRRRFLGAVPSPAALESLVVPARGWTWAAYDGAGVVHGVAHLVHDEDLDEWEFAVLVEDAWQQRGLGRRLASATSDRARRHRIAHVVAHTRSGNTGALGVLRGMGQLRLVSVDAAVLCIEVDIPPFGAAVPVPAPALLPFPPYAQPA